MQIIAMQINGEIRYANFISVKFDPKNKCIIKVSFTDNPIETFLRIQNKDFFNNMYEYRNLCKNIEDQILIQNKVVRIDYINGFALYFKNNARIEKDPNKLYKQFKKWLNNTIINDTIVYAYEFKIAMNKILYVK